MYNALFQRFSINLFLCKLGSKYQQTSFILYIKKTKIHFDSYTFDVRRIDFDVS